MRWATPVRGRGRRRRADRPCAIQGGVRGFPRRRQPGLPRHRLAGGGQAQGKDFRQRPVGTGPFVFKEWVRQDHITLERNPDYQWASPVFKHQGPAHLDRVVFKIIPEDATRLATLENAETNFIETVPEQDLARLRADSRFKLIVGSIPGLPIGVFLNTQKEPTDALEVRQAILQGLSRADIIKTVYFGAYEPAHGPLARNTLAYNKKVESLHPFDRGRARELLERAGWKVGAGADHRLPGRAHRRPPYPPQHRRARHRRGHARRRGGHPHRAAAPAFLGLGAQPPSSEWGAMLSDGRSFLRRAWWVTTFPGLAITVTVLAINMVGDGLRDALDPRLKT
jgi:Bacterial extracellular solute-binding proteins, family 5 Middle